MILCRITNKWDLPGLYLGMGLSFPHCDNIALVSDHMHPFGRQEWAHLFYTDSFRMEWKGKWDWCWRSNYTVCFIRPKDWKDMETPGREGNIRRDSRKIFCTCKVHDPAVLTVDLQQPSCSIVLQVQIYSHQINYGSKLVYISSYLLACRQSGEHSDLVSCQRTCTRFRPHISYPWEELHALLAVWGDMHLGRGIASFNMDSEAYHCHEISI